MSRTYHHSIRNFKKFKPNTFIAWYHNGWISNEPKWWRKMTKHKKRRAEWRNLKENTKDWDDVAYPLDSKPWIYYW